MSEGGERTNKNTYIKTKKLVHDGDITSKKDRYHVDNAFRVVSDRLAMNKFEFKLPLTQLSNSRISYTYLQILYFISAFIY